MAHTDPPSPYTTRALVPPRDPGLTPSPPACSLQAEAFCRIFIMRGQSAHEGVSGGGAGGGAPFICKKVPLWTKRIDDENARPAARASKPEEIGAEHGPHGRPFLPFWNGYCAINIGRETSDSRGGSASEARAFHQGTRKTRPPLPNPTSSPP